MSTGQVWIEVHTSKRSYCVLGGVGRQAIWERGEKVVSVEVMGS